MQLFTKTLVVLDGHAVARFGDPTPLAVQEVTQSDVTCVSPEGTELILKHGEYRRASARRFVLACLEASSDGI